ncbi:MAG: hypothetical protein QF570_15705 [Myxococcota bacterium]|nr:hypothetical protein [Myxococcota bacterium]
MTSTVAMAAEVVDMRLGRHPSYTRIVFELDAPAGYSLEQSAGAEGGTELVVTLDAQGQDQQKALKQSLVSGVTLESAGKRSVARIRIPKDGLRVKEMILGDPPRIVLDVLAPAAAKTKTAAAPAPKAEARPRAAAPAASKPVAKAPAPRAPMPPASINKGASPAPTRVATRKPAKATPPAARPAVKPAKVAPVVKQAAKTPAATPVRKSAAKTPAPGVKAKPAAKTPPPPARKKPAVPAAPAAAPQPEGSGLFTPTNLGGGLALIALVGGGTWFMMRRRGGKELVTDEDFESDPMSADNPFATLGDDFAVASESEPAEETAEVTFGEPEEDIPEANVVDEFASDDGDEAAEEDVVMASTAAATEPQADLFGTSVMEAIPADDDQTMPGEETAGAAGDDMEAYGDTVDAGMDAMPPMTGAGAGASDDTMRMLREFEQRMASLESRLDEVSEAKERLERQVVAQTEELRVQRAAIARTQRALRNLSRPDDESPTEPALRGDPNA